MNQQVALGLLQQQGHQVEVVSDGRAAVDAVRAGAWDVVLMDVHMPVMDGRTATGEIRRLPGERGRVPIVAMSASVTAEETDGFLAAGMDGYVAKPIDPAALAAVLAGLPGARPDDAGPSRSPDGRARSRGGGRGTPAPAPRRAGLGQAHRADRGDRGRDGAPSRAACRGVRERRPRGRPGRRPCGTGALRPVSAWPPWLN